MSLVARRLALRSQCRALCALAATQLALSGCPPPTPATPCQGPVDCRTDQRCDVARGHCYPVDGSSALDAGHDAAVVDAADAAVGDAAVADSAGAIDGGCPAADAGSTCPATLVCPAGYVQVPGSLAAGSWPCSFCVAKYEMKAQRVVDEAVVDGLNLSGSAVHLAISATVERPWTGLTLAEAREQCWAQGTGHHLLTNAEWMTVARDIAATAANWSNQQVGGAAVNSGHSDCSVLPGDMYQARVDVETDFLAASVDDDPCFGTGNASCAVHGNPDFSQKRTHRLSNGELIWDFVGNVNEWVDVDVCGRLLDYQRSAGGEFVELDSADATYAYSHMAPLARHDFMPEVDGVTGSYSLHGLGKIRLVGSAGLHQGLALFRSGKYCEECQGEFTLGVGNHRVGIFTAWIMNGPGQRYGNLGFRCAYRLQ